MVVVISCGLLVGCCYFLRALHLEALGGFEHRSFQASIHRSYHLPSRPATTTERTVGPERPSVYRRSLASCCTASRGALPAMRHGADMLLVSDDLAFAALCGYVAVACGCPPPLRFLSLSDIQGGVCSGSFHLSHPRGCRPLCFLVVKAEPCTVKGLFCDGRSESPTPQAPPIQLPLKVVQLLSESLGDIIRAESFLPPPLPPVLSLPLFQRRSRSSAVMHVTPEGIGSNPGGVGTQCSWR